MWMVLLPKFSHWKPTLNIATVIWLCWSTIRIKKAMWLVHFKVLIHILFDHSSSSFTMRPHRPANCDHIITMLHSGVSGQSIHLAWVLSPGFVLNTVLRLLYLLGDIQPSSLLPTSAMQSILFICIKLTTQFKLPSLWRMSPTCQSLLKLLGILCIKLV